MVQEAAYYIIYYFCCLKPTVLYSVILSLLQLSINQSSAAVVTHKHRFTSGPIASRCCQQKASNTIAKFLKFNIGYHSLSGSQPCQAIQYYNVFCQPVSYKASTFLIGYSSLLLISSSGSSSWIYQGRGLSTAFLSQLAWKRFLPLNQSGTSKIKSWPCFLIICQGSIYYKSSYIVRASIVKPFLLIQTESLIVKLICLLLRLV